MRPRGYRGKTLSAKQVGAALDYWKLIGSGGDTMKCIKYTGYEGAPYGYADLELSSGLVIRSCMVHAKFGWMVPPADIDFRDEETRGKFIAAALKAVIASQQ